MASLLPSHSRRAHDDGVFHHVVSVDSVVATKLLWVVPTLSLTAQVVLKSRICYCIFPIRHVFPNDVV